MAQVAMTPDQSARLQGEVQQELERREWAEPDDNVMAEYITVLIGNGSSQERVQSEMDDLVGSDFDPRFLDWLFAKAADIARPEPSPAPGGPPSHPASAGTSRLLNTAIASSQSETNKRRHDSGPDGPVKKRLSDGFVAPAGPRAMGSEGRNLADRMGPRGGRGGMQVRGAAAQRQPGAQNMGRMNNGGGMSMGGVINQPMGFQQGFQSGPQMMQPGFGPSFFAPGTQEMMAQMMMMQANMAQMGEMMAHMVEDKQQVEIPQPQSVRPARPPSSIKVPHGTKLGKHSVSAITPKTVASPGPIPDKPSSTALCRYSVGCSNSRCPYSHPSPVADEKTGMVLSEEACRKGKGCRDAECTKSHVSPAAALGDNAGPSRLLCKYQHCTNPSCPFRHEDADGNPIPPPALTALKQPKPTKEPQPSSDNEDGDVEVVMSHKGLMNGPLDDAKASVACRYAEQCTRPDCKFTHPASRVAPKAQRSFGKPATNGSGSGMNMSKKFGAAAEQKLDPTVGEFQPKAEALPEPEKDLPVSS